MSALKDFSYKEDEDGDIPALVRGNEQNLNDILRSTTCDGGNAIVSNKKIEQANKQLEIDTSNRAVRIPVTIITGYLGSGKSTLLEKIAIKGSDKKIAVILNEFGDSSEIEKSMTIRDGENSYEEWLDLGNGCLCCSLQDVGVKAIESLISRCPGKIDYILLETSGIADPRPIAKMFWQDDGLYSNVYLDAIITVLDAENVLTCLDDVSPATHWHGEEVMVEENITISHLQIAMADSVILNKMDKISSEGLAEKIENKIRQINSIAPIHHASYGEVPLSELMNLHAFESFKFEQGPSGVIHDPRICTVTISFRPLKNESEFERFRDGFLRVVHWKDFGHELEGDWEIHRTKGMILVGDSCKIIQGVRETFDILPGNCLEEAHECKMVFIGKGISEPVLLQILEKVVDI
ncbi:LANO_0A01574g1_1 [Lachancea nothofagi CBS 11611]|uniref:LANO_0A01574g1_1 n=1 Tax=Lachancea nothofagi CBS 11611 TaxID=1266666 RepID=A0A1G4IN56_9SACH|nr:LANO_0A01574g1_1 [Lachancea nothofagi CBS 11611]